MTISVQFAPAPLKPDWWDLMFTPRDRPPVLKGRWPDPRKFPTARKLFAVWRWVAEEYPEAALNAYFSVENAARAIGVSVFEGGRP